jgi:hypothetical protein
VLWRSSNYRKACSSGFQGTYWEAHHIACNHAVEGRVIKVNRAYVEDCLWITDWDLNDPDNLIGLPEYAQYKFSSGASPQNYCAHDVDHNTSDGYTEECKTWLKDNVWDTLNDKKKKHDVNAEAIRQQLVKCTSLFKGKLERRGIRKGGTLVCYRNRFEPGWEDKWYYPFSMADLPRKRHPGTKRDLDKLFQQIS